MTMTNPRLIEKPKRPLSGYNLFYRYKRTKIMEATAHFFPAGSASSAEEKAVILAVLRALSGLENVPAHHPIWSLPPEVRNELRASNIRQVMEDKLMPNDQTRTRLHRKSHGMGFVEMGKLMREAYAELDKWSKDTFNELADIGRATYRKKLAAYKLQLHGGSASTAEEALRKSAFVEGQAWKMQAMATAPAVMDSAPFSGMMMAAATTINPPPSMVEATPVTSKKLITLPLLGVATPHPSAGAPAMMMHASPADMMFCQAVTPASEKKVFTAKDLASLEPISVSQKNQFCVPITPASSDSPLCRRASAPADFVGHVDMTKSAPPAKRASMPDAAAVTNSPRAKAEVDRSAFPGLAAAIPPPPLFEKQKVPTDAPVARSDSTSDLSSSDASDHGTSRKGSPWPQLPLTGAAEGEEEEDDVSTHDMLRLITELDGALDDTHIAMGGQGMMMSGDKRPSLIFGQLVHDV